MEINIKFMCIRLLNILRPIYNEHCVNLLIHYVFFLLQAFDKDADDQDKIFFELVNKNSSFSITKEGGVLSAKSPLNKTDTGVLTIMVYNSRNYANRSLSNKTQKISVRVQVFNLEISHSITEHCTSQSKFSYLSQRVQY